MAKLNQIIAIEKGTKSRVYAELNDMNKKAQKSALFSGFKKTYHKKDDTGEDLPEERKAVEESCATMLKRAEEIMSELFKVTARKDWSNTAAKATVRVNGTLIASDVPVTYLLFMEKQLQDLKTLIDNMPVLDVADHWQRDPNTGLYRGEETQTHRTKKVQRPIVLYDATEEHPAQTQLITEDVIAGYWHQVKQSGALPKLDKMAMLQRVEHVLNAVKEAREEANGQDEIASPDIGQALFNYVLRG